MTTKLSVQKKAEILHEIAQPNTSMRTIARKYGVCDKTVRRIAQNGNAIKTMLKYSSNSGRCHVAVNLQFPEINESVYEWFCGKQERCGNFPITDEIVKTYATRLATRLKISEFKASNGWLRSWKSRYNIALRKVSPLVLFWYNIVIDLRRSWRCPDASGWWVSAQISRNNFRLYEHLQAAEFEEIDLDSDEVSLFPFEYFSQKCYSSISINYDLW